ncbi:hypothetical protein CRUP_033966 [Coryphaenoides rupestris]|nr:hypothetical protein CRUP_033966 [Coryphaenoides rupestris]
MRGILSLLLPSLSLQGVLAPLSLHTERFRLGAVTVPHCQWGEGQATKDPMVVENIMQDLDENQDGEVDFQEYVVLVAALTVACNEFFMQNQK